MTTRERESKQRQDIRQRQDSLCDLISRLQDGGPMIKGSVYNRSRRCGKPQCRCARGQPHRDRVLAVKHSGRIVIRRLGASVDSVTGEAVLAWRLFRRNRAELARACRCLLRAVDGLAALRMAKSGGRW
jgi:hypothetical protein